jgi:hypothetical protein
LHAVIITGGVKEGNGKAADLAEFADFANE